MEITLAAGERLHEINESLRLVEREGTLAFGTDAYLLYAFMRPAARATAIELGCGNGAVSLLAAARGRFAHIHAVEIQGEMTALAARNVALNGLSEKVTVHHADARRLTPALFGGEAEIVFANPPYMRTDSGFASPSTAKQIARHECEGGIFEFAAAAAKCVKYGGLFYTVYRPDRAESLFAALRENGFAPKRMLLVQDHPAAAPSIMLTEAKRGAAEGLSLLPPLILHTVSGDTALSPRAQRVYDTGKTD